MSNAIGVPDSWFTTLFVEQLSLAVACRVWDQILLEGDGFIFRTCASRPVSSTGPSSRPVRR